MNKILLSAVMLGLLLTGCAANQKTMDRGEFISATQRTYEGVGEDQFYKAAEKLLKLADDDDTTFAYPSEHALIAQRSWTIYLVFAFTMGTHVWQINTEPTENGIKANMLVSNSSSAVSGMATGGGGASTSTTPQMSGIVNTPAIYELFWQRMDYLLGKSVDWPTCDDWDEKVSQGQTYGNIEPLCLALNTDDLSPSDNQSL